MSQVYNLLGNIEVENKEFKPDTPIGGTKKKRTKELGRIKWWSEDRGFGFIHRPPNVDAFFHISNVSMGYNNILEQDIVEYEMIPAEDGSDRMKAVNVTLITSNTNLEIKEDQ